MENSADSARFLQQRRFYMMLPVLVIPFVTLIYWVLFVKGAKPGAQTAHSQGLLTSLPDAMLKEDNDINKLSFYQRAAADSARLSELIRKDPYHVAQTANDDTLQTGQLAGLQGPVSKKEKPVSYRGKTYTGASEVKIIRKLNQLDKALSSPAEPAFSPVDKDINIPDPGAGDQIRKLETLMSSMQNGPARADVYADPEIAELNGMLDKIIRIQNPELDGDKVKEQSEAGKQKVFSVQNISFDNPVNLLSTGRAEDSLGQQTLQEIPFEQSGFFGLDQSAVSSASNAFSAAIAQDQTITAGSTIKLSLTQDIYIAGILIPKGSFVYGVASLNNERLIIKITSVRYENSLLPVKLSVYDLDGIAGIYIPGAIERDVAKQSLSQDIQGVSIGSIDPSLGAQAASAGIQTAKTLMSRKTRLLQVKVKAGYQVLLRDLDARG